ncbi:hypothetical protein POZ03_16695 [Bacteroides uniformis]|uniref:glycoside hydrolase family protein n=1 Tax=Bacteroides uniformis TaxID=820 RepID=UPI00233EEB2D|nr:hypothetical protein [Bacteroides uniformis]MDC1812099.1 hypothetical protein [Bacteroides uniformis]
MVKLFIASYFFFLLNIKASTGPPQSPQIIIETDMFEEAVRLIKQYEGWHNNHYPYVGYGHRIIAGEKFGSDISEEFADSLLRNDLKQKCAIFKRFGKDSLLLGTLSYNVGEYRLLGYKKKPKSSLIQKLESGNRDIEQDYLSYRIFNGKVLLSLEKRRKAEFDLLFNKTKLKFKTMIKEGSIVTIKPSEALSIMRLDYLISREATVIQDLTSIARLNKGFMVELTEPYMDETEWFIPMESIIDEDE